MDVGELLKPYLNKDKDVILICEDPESKTVTGLISDKVRNVIYDTTPLGNAKNSVDISLFYIDHPNQELDILNGIFMVTNKPTIVVHVDEKLNIENNILKSFLAGVGYSFVENSDLSYYIFTPPMIQSKVKEKPLPPSTLDKNIKIVDLFTNEWEELLEAARKYRLAGKNLECYDLIKKCTDVPTEKRHLLDYELTIAAYYIGKIQEGYDACDRISLDFNANFSMRNHCLNSIRFYIKKLDFTTVSPVSFPLENGWYPSSSSFVKYNDGYRINLRTVDYQITDSGNYICAKPGTVTTRNFIVDTDKNFVRTNSFELFDRTDNPKYKQRLLGLEDVRLIDSKSFFATYPELNPNNTPQMAYGEFDENGINKIVPLSLTAEIKCEKNWLPFYHDENLHFIYSFSPFQLYRLEKDGTIVSVINHKLIDRVEETLDFRGSAAPIKYRDGYLLTIHQVNVNTNSHRNYYHRFVYLSSDFKTVRYSKLFYFEKIGIEYNIGLLIDGEQVVMLYSVNDRSSMIMTLELKVVDQMLKFD